MQVVSVPTWSAFFAKVLTQVAGGRPPDIIGIATEGAQLIGAKGLALPLDDLIKRDQAELGDVNPILLEPFKYKGKTLALPYSWNNMVIFYNTKMFKNLGIPTPTATWAGNDFLSAARKVKASGPYGYNLWSSGTFGIVCWMYAAGGGLLDHPTLTKSTATNPANVKAMQFLQDLIWRSKVAPRPGAPDFPLFEAGRVGMISAGRWPITSFNGRNSTTTTSSISRHSGRAIRTSWASAPIRSTSTAHMSRKPGPSSSISAPRSASSTSPDSVPASPPGATSPTMRRR